MLRRISRLTHYDTCHGVNHEARRAFYFRGLVLEVEGYEGCFLKLTRGDFQMTKANMVHEIVEHFKDASAFVLELATMPVRGVRKTYTDIRMGNMSDSGNPVSPVVAATSTLGWEA